MNRDELISARQKTGKKKCRKLRIFLIIKENTIKDKIKFCSLINCRIKFFPSFIFSFLFLLYSIFFMQLLNFAYIFVNLFIEVFLLC